MKKRILFVDDDLNILEGLRRMLYGQRNVWDMSFISNAYDALEQIRNTVFDAVVVDVQMPGMDGFGLLENILKKEGTKDIPVLIVTGSGDSHLKQRALDMGATDLLNKPVQKEDLIARLNNMLRLKSYHDTIIAQNILLEQKVKERTMELEISRMDIIWRLGKIAEFRDKETGNHIIRVGCYCRAIAESLGMRRDFVETLFLTSPLHDIGKIGIPDNILLKEDKLTPEEFEKMKRHCNIGVEILQQDYSGTRFFLEWCGMQSSLVYKNDANPLLAMASSIIMAHHERWDGSGYPNNLRGEEIPLEARIVALADVYDALCSSRTYKKSYTEEESLSIMGKEVGKHFDPNVYAAFEKVIGELSSIRLKFSD